MRERKYRAFVKQCNKMIYSENSYPKGNSNYRFVASEEHKKGLGVEYFTSRTEYVSQYGSVILLPDWRIFTDEEAPVTEYAGLKDVNGRMIYDGDVAKFSFYDEGENIRFMHIVFEGSGFKMKEIYRNYWLEKNNGVLRIKRGIQTDHKGTLQELYKSNEFYSLEVIGDVYRNPELLEAAE